MGLERIGVAPDGATFRRGRAPFFYFADTVWSVFTNARIGEWRDYLAVRESQGFNVLQINVLPQWDRSKASLKNAPFAIGADGGYDFFKPEEAYFDKAEEFVSLAAEAGMHCALVLLWCDFVPDTWATKKGHGGPVMPLEAVGPYVEYVARRFKPYAPIYLASGDTDFPTDLAISHYAEALKTVKRVDPGCLTTLHMQPHAEIPPPLMDMGELDFYMYQSGHAYEGQYRTWDWAERFMKAPVKRPIVNGEPCYDCHKHGMKQGRFASLDIRRAFFQSVLSGAKAGFTYGAHGLWCWHGEGMVFKSEFSGSSYSWRTALGFEGAWDSAFCVHLAQEYGLRAMSPLANAKEALEPWFLAADPALERFALYLPALAAPTIPLDATLYDCDLYMLGTKRIGKPKFLASAGGSTLVMPEVEGDALIVGRRADSVRPD